MPTVGLFSVFHFDPSLFNLLGDVCFLQCMWNWVIRVQYMLFKEICSFVLFTFFISVGWVMGKTCVIPRVSLPEQVQ